MRRQLALPIGPEQPVGGGHVAPFQNGEITWSPQTGTRVIPAPFSTAYDLLGGPTSYLGMPVSSVTNVYDIKGQPVGQVLLFQGGALFSSGSGVVDVNAHIARAFLLYQANGRSLGVATAKQANPGDPIELVNFTDGVGYWSPATGARVLADASTLNALQRQSGLSLTDPWGNAGNALQKAVDTKFGVQISANGTLSLNLAQQTAYADIDYNGFKFTSAMLVDLLGGTIDLPDFSPIDFLASLAHTGATNQYLQKQQDAYGGPSDPNAANVYFSSARFVDWASPDVALKLVGQAAMGDGSGALQELIDNLSSEVQSIVAWATRKFGGDEASAVQALAAAFEQNPKTFFTVVKVPYDYRIFGGTFEEDHYAFQITLPGAPGPLDPRTNMIATATAPSAASTGVSSADLQNLLGTFAVGLIDQVFNANFDPHAFDLGSAVASNLANTYLYRQLFTMMGLSPDALVQAYQGQGGPVLVDLTSTAGQALVGALNNLLGPFGGGDLGFSVSRMTFNTSTYELSAQFSLDYSHSWGTIGQILWGGAPGSGSGGDGHPMGVEQMIFAYAEKAGGAAAKWYKQETGTLPTWWQQKTGLPIPPMPWMNGTDLPGLLQDLGLSPQAIGGLVQWLGSGIENSPVGKGVNRILAGQLPLNLVDGQGIVAVN